MSEPLDNGVASRLARLEKSLEGLATERQRAVDVASEEREKAAVALRIALERAIEEGDDRLREHVSNQIVQIREALSSADKLELARVSRVEEKADAHFEFQKEATVAQNNSNKEAISKAEAATAETVKTNQELTTTKTDALTKGLDELKLQVSRIESIKVGAVENKQEQRAQISSTSAVVGIAAALLGTLALYFGIHARDGITTPTTPADTSGQFQSFDSRLQVVEQRSTANEVRIGAIEQLDQFFCRTRQPTLSACP